MPKKTILFIILILVFVVILIIIGLIFFCSRGEPNNNANIGNNLNLTNEEYVEYNESYGKVCPLGVKFLGAKDAPEIGCECPAGYEFESEIIGYSTGESCYGAGTECPIMSLECVLIN